MRKQQKNFRLPPELAEWLRQTASDYRTLSMADIVRISLYYMQSLTKKERDRIMSEFALTPEVTPDEEEIGSDCQDESESKKKGER